MSEPTTEPVPTRIALYALLASDSEPVAIYHWDPAGGVRLQLLNPKWSRVATEYYERGVENYQERRQVLPAEGPLFMRTLLLPKNMTYYSLVDESNR